MFKKVIRCQIEPVMNKILLKTADQLHEESCIRSASCKIATTPYYQNSRSGVIDITKSAQSFTAIKNNKLVVLSQKFSETSTPRIIRHNGLVRNYEAPLTYKNVKETDLILKKTELYNICSIKEPIGVGLEPIIITPEASPKFFRKHTDAVYFKDKIIKVGSSAPLGKNSIYTRGIVNNFDSGNLLIANSMDANSVHSFVDKNEISGLRELFSIDAIIKTYDLNYEASITRYKSISEGVIKSAMLFNMLGEVDSGYVGLKDELSDYIDINYDLYYNQLVTIDGELRVLEESDTGYITPIKIGNEGEVIYGKAIILDAFIF